MSNIYHCKLPKHLIPNMGIQQPITKITNISTMTRYLSIHLSTHHNGIICLALFDNICNTNETEPENNTLKIN